MVHDTLAMKRAAALFQSIPTLLPGLALFGCAAMLVFNLLAGVAAPSLQLVLTGRLFRDLSGVERPATVPLTRQTLLDGSYQAGVARRVGRDLPLFTAAVRFRNQSEYSVFHTTTNPTLLVGTGRQLVEKDYVTEYCGRNLARFVPFAARWVDAIKFMQDTVERRGAVFVYVITPSKPAQYPGLIPRGMPCLAPDADRTGLVPFWTDQLRRAGVHFVDLTAVLTQAKPRYPFPLYPQGGIHWNAVGATLAGQAVASFLAVAWHDGSFPPLDFTWRMVDRPDPGSSDVDLARLMNLVWLPKAQPVPAVTFKDAATRAGCVAHSVAVVGGSFSNSVAEYLSREPCSPPVDVYEYWSVFSIGWARGRPSYQPVDAAARTRDVLGADVLIYEANEQTLAGEYHGRPLLDFLATHQ